MQAQEVPGPEGPLMAQGGEIAFVPMPSAHTQGHQYRSQRQHDGYLGALHGAGTGPAWQASPSGESNSWSPSRRSHRPGVALVGVSVRFRTRLYCEFRNNVSTQLLNDFLSRALSVFEIQDNVVHPDLLKRLQQKTQMVASQFEP